MQRLYINQNNNMRLKGIATNVSRGGLLTLLLVTQMGRAETTNLAAVADTSLHTAFPGLNFGGGTSFTSGGRNMGGHARALLRFDIASRLPAGATINSVELTISAVNVNGPDSTFDLHRVLAAWGEGAGDDRVGSVAQAGDATWTHRLAPGTAWLTAGGDYQAESSGSQLVAGLGSYTFSAPGMAADVQAWLDNPTANYGWLLRSQTETTLGTVRRFAGRAALANAPVLVVDYSLTTPAPAEPPVLSAPVRVGNEIQFSFNAQSNRTYAVEFRDTLGGGAWNVLTNVPALPADATVHVTNGITGAERYFRARTP